MESHYQQFKNIVIGYYDKHGRHHLPWRKDQSPYAVLISEVMLQQTQVDRVVLFFERWMKRFPTLEKLARAKQVEVLKLWKGLGYNSRALRLQKCAQIIVRDYGGSIPKNYQDLLKLPGVGPYTAGAIMNFAFNEWTPLIETNIRRVFIHHFFQNEQDVSDEQILERVREVGFERDARTWLAGLMDYGARLPKMIKQNPNRQSKHYTKQSKFRGSDRQLRGLILELLLNEKNHRMSERKIVDRIMQNEESGFFCSSETEKTALTTRIKKTLHKLEREGFLKREKRSFVLSE